MTSKGANMDVLPDHLVGEIMARLTAKEVIRGLAISKKFMFVVKHELPSLRIELEDWNDDVSSENLERSVLLITGLKSLTINLKGGETVPDTCVIRLLMHARESLVEFRSNTWIMPNLNNILANLPAVPRLEVLALGHSHIGEVPEFLNLDGVKSLSLTDLVLQSPNLVRVLAACGKLQVLNLESLIVDGDGNDTTLELHIPTLVEICLQRLKMKDFLLIAELLERLKVKECRLNTFKLEGKHCLRFLELNSIYPLESLNCDERANGLEVVKLEKLEVEWDVIQELIGSSRQMKELSLLNMEHLNFEAIAAHFPLLKTFSCTYPAGKELLAGKEFTNLKILEVEWDLVDPSILDWVTKLLLGCPVLIKCIFWGIVSAKRGDKLREDMKSAGTLNKLLRDTKFANVEFYFDYK